MRLLTYARGEVWMPGIALGDRIVDLTRAAVAAGILASDERSWLSNRAALELTGQQRAALADAARGLIEDPSVSRPRREERLGPPISDPEKIVCLGLNYADHASETGMDRPPAPVLFAKYRNSLIGHEAPIRLPRAGAQIDYEGELAIVIGSRCKDVAAEHALDHVAGAMAFNDVTARDLQFQTGQWLAGKALDTFAPTGPELVLFDEPERLQSLDLETRVNGVTVQRANTAQMIFSIAATIAFVTQLMTLEPGDIIATGTPAGVGFTRDPQLLLADGDVVEVEIEAVGTLRNPVAGA